jgi:RHS repeat-associated protein
LRSLRERSPAAREGRVRPRWWRSSGVKCTVDGEPTFLRTVVASGRKWLTGKASPRATAWRRGSWEVRMTGRTGQRPLFKRGRWVAGSRDGRVRSSIDNARRFSGREVGAAMGLQFNRWRFYHRQLGRWVGRDPIGYVGDGWNLYEYVSGMPIRHVDPAGQEICCEDFDDENHYARSKCWFPCAVAGCTQNKGEAAAIEAIENANDSGYPYLSREHSALRHCIWSGLLAARCSCECAQCVVDNCDLYQYACGGQSARNTRQALYNDEERRKCAGCTGKGSTDDRRVPASHPGQPGNGWYVRQPFTKIVECCLDKLKNGKLATERRGDVPPVPLPVR